MKSFIQYLTEAKNKVISNPKFIKWFSGSKVVDKLGNPLVVYHGSRSPWVSHFDLDMEGTGINNTGNSKYGVIWFTDSKENADFYADKTPKKKAVDTSIYGSGDKFYISVDDKNGESIFLDGPYSTYDKAEDNADSVVALYNKNLRKDTFICEVYLRIKNPLILNKIIPRGKEIEKAKSEGRDGIIAENVADGQYYGTVYVVFSPSQIKSTKNNGDFDVEDGNIFR